MSGLRERLKERPLLLADGAWGSELLQRGLYLSLEPADSWNLRFPDTVRGLATDYAAYADILTTNTFGANRARLSAYRLQRKVRKINTRGVALVRDAERGRRILDRPILVAGTMGPARGPAAGTLDEKALFEVYQEQAGYLADAGARFLLLETMTDLAEARTAVRAAKTCGLEVVCSFAFRETEAGVFQTWSGASVAAALGAALEAGADMVGANCVPATASLVPLVASMRGVAVSAPLWLKPNAGEPTGGMKQRPIARTFTERLRGRLSEYRQGWRDYWTMDPWDDTYQLYYPHPLDLAPLDDVLDALGTGVIGGCCGTSPMDILRLRMALDRRAGLRP